MAWFRGSLGGGVLRPEVASTYTDPEQAKGASDKAGEAACRSLPAGEAGTASLPILLPILLLCESLEHTLTA